MQTARRRTAEATPSRTRTSVDPPANPSARSRFTRPRAIRIVVALIALDLLICGVGIALGGYELLRAQSTLQGGGSRHLTELRGELRGRVGVASIAFDAARLAWLPWRPLAAAVGHGPLHLVSVVGPILDLATDLSQAGVNVLDGITPAFAAMQQAHHSTADLVNGLQKGEPAIRRSVQAVTRAESDWAAISEPSLPGAIRTKLDSLGRLLPTLDDATRIALALPDLLGVTHARTYLIAPENPWDLRATGGFIGTAVVLEANRGSLTLPASESSSQVDEHRLGYVPLPLPLTMYPHLSNWFYRDANWSPDFPTTAQLLRYFYRLGTHHETDGVIAFDSSLLPLLLQLTGPVQVPGIPTALTPSNAISQLDRYVNSAGGANNKAIASQAYNKVFSKLRQLPAAKLTEALRVLGTALQQRHLLLWLPDKTIAPILARHGWDGAIDQTRDDYLYVVDTNVHYNKISQLVDEVISYRGLIQSDRSILSTLAITYSNKATLANIPRPQNNTTYEDFVRVYVPLGSRLLGTSGLTQPWPTARDHNKTMFAGYVRLPSGTHATITFTYTVPPNALLDSTTYQLTVQKQPGAADRPLSAALSTNTPGVSVNGGTQWAWSGALSTDLHLSTSLSGGRAQPIPLVYDDNTTTQVGPGTQIGPWTVIPYTMPP